jgi:NAD-dependent DNA ligase
MDSKNINEIVQKLVQADACYYNSGSSIMEDIEYDALKEMILKNDPTHPYLKNVGNASVSDNWVKHLVSN